MRRLLVVLACGLALVGCSDRALIRNASAAYQYQHAIYRHTCPQPPPHPVEAEPCLYSPGPPPPVDAGACVLRLHELKEDFCQIAAADDAVVKSAGGVLPKKARVTLKQITKELSQ